MKKLGFLNEDGKIELVPTFQNKLDADNFFEELFYEYEDEENVYSNVYSVDVYNNKIISSKKLEKGLSRNDLRKLFDISCKEWPIICGNIAAGAEIEAWIIR